MFSLRIFIFSTLLLLFAIVNAAPTTPPPSPKLPARSKTLPAVLKSGDPKDWPSKGELETKMATGPDQANFWKGKDGADSAEERAHAHALATGGTTLEGQLEHHQMKMPPHPSDAAGNKKWEEASQEFAKGAKGHVTAHVGDHANSVYDNIERPALVANPHVHSINEIKADGSSAITHHKPSRSPTI
jgi:hypothetical protein